MALISAGWTYQFVFKKKFTPYNGTYTIAKIYSWAELVKDQLALFELLYAPLNIPQEEYNQDVLEYRNDNIYKLVSPENGATVYAPESIFSQLPIYPVKEYQQLVLFIPLGVYDNVEGIDYLVDQVTSELRGALGVDCVPKLTSVAKAYLTEKDYALVETSRKARVDRILNWFSSYKRLQTENAQLKAQIDGYQKLLNNELGEAK